MSNCYVSYVLLKIGNVKEKECFENMTSDFCIITNIIDVFQTTFEGMFTA